MHCTRSAAAPLLGVPASCLKHGFTSTSRYWEGAWSSIAVTAWHGSRSRHCVFWHAPVPQVAVRCGGVPYLCVKAPLRSPRGPQHPLPLLWS